ncbi:M48 family peptidase, partial [Pseudomonas aeruginosa]
MHTDEVLAGVWGKVSAQARAVVGREALSKAYGVQVACQIGALAGLGQESLQQANTGVDYLMTLPNSPATDTRAALTGLQ